jgi:hypothetical protein
MEPVLHLTRAYIEVESAVMLGKQMIEAAELVRRTGAGTFDAGPTSDGNPAADWAAACILISRAVHHLDEALPSGQKERTIHAFGALLLGVELLEAALARRTLVPSRLSIGGMQPAPVRSEPRVPGESDGGASPAYVDQARDLLNGQEKH